MHEFSIIQGLIQEVNEYIARENYESVLKISLEIGQMSGVVQDALEFAWDVSTKETTLDGVLLDISIVPVKAGCRKCLKEFQVEGYCFSCPHCKSPDLNILSGYELKIKEMDVEEGDG